MMAETENSIPIGRFAPSPTGPLHFGSLVAAVGSYLQARRRGGRWLVRMEDLDPPREVPGAADLILRALEAYGFEWDGEVLYQSTRQEAYSEAIRELERQGRVYRCTCSRKMIAERIAAEGGLPGIYPGTCRAAHRSPREPHAVRIIAEGPPIAFDDAVQGPIRSDVRAEVGDFVIRRTDGLFAYQLAVVVDDAEQGVTEVVRGSDLLDSTARQILLQRALGLPTPAYLHLPVAVNARGEKLSKQTHAAPLNPADPVPTLWAALRFLGQAPPEELEKARLDELWKWALARWDAAATPRRMEISEPETGSRT